ncbi:MAG: class I SAM-dependent methyltransferase [Candidatus Thorarchaeota archaeon]
MTDTLYTQWEANAKAYAQLINDKGTPHHREILNPCIEQLLGEVQGKHLLDAGCGEGYLSRVFAKKGAKVVGVDFSPNLIAISRKKSEGFDIDFQVGNICNLDSLVDNQFDCILCNLVLLNVECLDTALQEFHRVLKPEGFLVFSVVHPAFNVYGPGRWEMGKKDSLTNRRLGLFFVNDNYFVEMEFQARWKSRSGQGFPQKFSFFHRTISTYMTSMMQAGFHVVAFEEPRPITDNPFFEREFRIPFFLVIKAEKPKRLAHV